MRDEAQYLIRIERVPPAPAPTGSLFHVWAGHSRRAAPGRKGRLSTQCLLSPPALATAAPSSWQAGRTGRRAEPTPPVAWLVWAAWLGIIPLPCLSPRHCSPPPPLPACPSQCQPAFPPPLTDGRVWQRDCSGKTHLQGSSLRLLCCGGRPSTAIRRTRTAAGRVVVVEGRPGRVIGAHIRLAPSPPQQRRAACASVGASDAGHARHAGHAVGRSVGGSLLPILVASACSLLLRRCGCRCRSRRCCHGCRRHWEVAVPCRGDPHGPVLAGAPAPSPAAGVLGGGDCGPRQAGIITTINGPRHHGQPGSLGCPTPRVTSRLPVPRTGGGHPLCALLSPSRPLVPSLYPPASPTNPPPPVTMVSNPVQTGLRICCIGAGYVGGPTMAMMALKCPEVTVTVRAEGEGGLATSAGLSAWPSDFCAARRRE